MISSSTFVTQVGYSRVGIVNNMIFLCDSTCYSYVTMTILENVIVQAEQSFKNIEMTLAQAGATSKNAVRATYILVNRKNFEPCLPIFRKYFEEVKPAATTLFAQLVNNKIKYKYNLRL
jgi:enamine deaminase RidA (YjgF/YER057c/UK114 family)